MRPPNSRHSEPRNIHIASLLLDSPVEVCPCSGSRSSGTYSEGEWTTTSAKGDQLLARARRRVLVLGIGQRGILRPTVDAEQDDDGADTGDPVVVDQSDTHDRQTERDDERPVRR